MTPQNVSKHMQQEMQVKIQLIKYSRAKKYENYIKQWMTNHPVDLSVMLRCAIIEITLRIQKDGSRSHIVERDERVPNMSFSWP